MNKSTNQFFKQVKANVDGRDFIIGDLHGCYDELLKLLAYVQFNSKQDRLFSTGDLLDRGPKSAECMELLNQDWFHCVLGNHEALLVDRLKQVDLESFQSIKNFSQEELKYLSDFPKYLDKIGQLPYVLEVEHMLHDKIYIVHAEFLPEHLLEKHVSYSYKEYEDLLNKFQSEDNSDKIEKFLKSSEFFDELEDHTIKQKLIWSRKIIAQFYNYHKDDILRSDFSFLNNKLDTKYKVFCGHNIVPFPIKIGQQYYLDTGAALGYSDKTINFKIFSKFGHEFFGLTMLDIGTGEVYHCITNEERRGKIVKMDGTLY